MSKLPFIKSREIKSVQEIPISKTIKFWENLKEGKIYATKCAKCGKLYFPPVADCSECFSSEMLWIELENKAVIETFTNVAIRPLSFSNNKPYIVAIGRMAEGVKVLAWLSGCEPSQVKVGMKAKLVARTLSEGNVPYEFIPDN